MEKKFIEAIEKSKALASIIKKQKEELHNLKTSIATEYTKNMTTEEKQKEIASLEKEIASFKEKKLQLKKEYKEKEKSLKEDFKVFLERIEFLNYGVRNSLPKKKNSQQVEGNFLVFNREGIKEIRVDITKANWEKTFKQELAKQGIDGNNRIADNLVYQAQLLIKAKNIKT